MTAEEAKAFAALWPSFRKDFQSSLTQHSQKTRNSMQHVFNVVEETLELDILQPHGVELTHE